MGTRPKLKPELTLGDKFIELTGWLALVFLWIITVFHYNSLPETIPTHFNAAGQTNAYGTKSTLFILPIIGTILFFGMSALSRFPHKFNYPVKITPENAIKQYTMATRLIRVLKLSTMILFTLIIWAMKQSALTGSDTLSVWLIIIVIMLEIVPTTYYIVKSIRSVKKSGH